MEKKYNGIVRDESILLFYLTTAYHRQSLLGGEYFFVYDVPSPGNEGLHIRQCLIQYIHIRWY
jgi:hypothetical protein